MRCFENLRQILRCFENLKEHSEIREIHQDSTRFIFNKIRVDSTRFNKDQQESTTLINKNQQEST